MLSTSLPGGTWTLGDLTVTRFGYGAMQLAGPGVMGPPADHDGALAVLREAVEPRHHPHRHLRRLRAARHQPADPGSAAPVPRVAAHRDQGRRDPGLPGRLAPGPRPGRAAPAVHENLEHLGLERLDVVNLRLGNAQGPQPGSLAEPFETLADSSSRA